MRRLAATLLVLTLGGCALKTLPSPDLGARFDCLRERNLALVAAHRGQPDRSAAENAMSSFITSLAAGVPFLEVDVATTKDGVLVLMHDDTVDRTTTGTGLVADRTWAELQALRIKRPDGTVLGDRVPRFSDVLEWGRQAGAHFELDVKRTTRFGDVVSAVHAAHMQDRVIVVTYSMTDAKTVHALDPRLMMSVTMEKPEDIAAARQVIDPLRLLGWTGTSDPKSRLFSALRDAGIEPIFGTLGRPGQRLDDLYLADGNPSEYLDLVRAGVVMIASDAAVAAQRAIGTGYRSCLGDGAGPAGAGPQPPVTFQVEEATIAQVHAAMTAKQLTCRDLVGQYLTRIQASDTQGPALNAIVQINPDALKEAEALDRRFAKGGLTGPLHCVPAIVKDNFETVGLQSADGSLSLEGFVSNKDAFLVKRIKAAGAIVIAKSNMAEFAFSPLETVNSILGTTKNPYALDRVPAGSSGGTAAAVASNFGLVGLGSDTGNSIRGPSSHNALVGIRSTMGLTSRAGVVPLSYLADVAGPMTRTVADAVAVFQVIVGEDPDDPMTARSHGREVPNYAASLVRDGLKGARIGVLRQAYERATLPVDEEIAKVFAKAIDDLKAAGADIIDPAPVDLSGVRRAQGSGTCRGFKFDINEYLAKQGDRVPVHNIDEILASGKFHNSVRARLEQAQRSTPQGPESDACHADAAYREAFGAAVVKAMDGLKLEAFIYPTWSQPPQLIGAADQQQAGDNSQVFAPTSGFPAINVPMGYTRGTLPIGMTIFGRAWSEATLIELAYAYEQATRHRRPPARDASTR